MNARRSPRLPCLFAAALLAGWLVPEPALAMRQYAAKQNRFMQRDPVASRPTAGSGYQDGLNLHEAVRCSPTRNLDPMGEACRIRWRRHKLWSVPPKYHVGVDIDENDDGDADYTVDYGWNGAEYGARLSCCNDNRYQSKPPDEWDPPVGPVGEPREYPDGENSWTSVPDCICSCLKQPTQNYGLYCLLGVPFPFNCSNSSGGLHSEVRRCNQCTGGQPGQDPPWIPGWISDGDEPGWDNVPDGSERTCAEIWGRRDEE